MEKIIGQIVDATIRNNVNDESEKPIVAKVKIIDKVVVADNTMYIVVGENNNKIYQIMPSDLIYLHSKNKL